MKAQPKDRFLGVFLLGPIEDMLALAREIASEADPKRQCELLELIERVSSARAAKDLDEVAAACFQLGAKAHDAAVFKGRRGERRWDEFVREKLLAGRTNREIEKEAVIAKILEKPYESKKSRDARISRIRKKLRDEGLLDA